MVRALGRFAHAVEAVDLQVWRSGQRGGERIPKLLRRTRRSGQRADEPAGRCAGLTDADRAQDAIDPTPGSATRESPPAESDPPKVGVVPRVIRADAVKEQLERLRDGQVPRRVLHDDRRGPVGGRRRCAVVAGLSLGPPVSVSVPASVPASVLLDADGQKVSQRAANFRLARIVDDLPLLQRRAVHRHPRGLVVGRVGGAEVVVRAPHVNASPG
mmetsp:Transcript_7640/g.30979  ORF Transcript_7640/g.30979 Transcript_7640/m.30979 type:complete len:215 (+) Transcript_7640:469-1113(+)